LRKGFFHERQIQPDPWRTGNSAVLSAILSFSALGRAWAGFPHEATTNHDKISGSSTKPLAFQRTDFKRPQLLAVWGLPAV